MLIYYGGEDTVTSEIAQRLVLHCLPEPLRYGASLVNVLQNYHGTAVFSRCDNIVKLGLETPVVCVFDSDSNCPVELLRESTTDGWVSPYSAINLAIEEGETWLVASKRSFSRYFRISQEHIPEAENGANEIVQEYKISLYLLNEVFIHSQSRLVRDTLRLAPRFRKPSTYNNLWPDFIRNYWDIDEAALHSVSLTRAIDRINRIFLPWLS
jgi:hypothetical protein